MRNLEDTIWGAWRPENRSLQIWNISRALLAEYNYRLDIAYDDSAFPVTGLYPEIHYWNESYTGGAANPIG